MSCPAQHRAARPSENQRAAGVGQNYLAAAVGGFSPPLSRKPASNSPTHRRLRRPDFRRLRPRPAQRQPAPMRQPDCPHRRQPVMLTCAPPATSFNTARRKHPTIWRTTNACIFLRRPRRPLAFSAKGKETTFQGLRTFPVPTTAKPCWNSRCRRIRHRPAAALCLVQAALDASSLKAFYPISNPNLCP